MPKNKNFDIQLRLLDYIPRGKHQFGVMRLVFEGSDFPSTNVSALGRVVSERLPTYAFPRDIVTFTKIDPATGYENPYVFNYDMITEHFSNLPLTNLDPGIDYLHEKYWKNVDYRDTEREKHENEKLVEASVTVRNESTDNENILRVTTNDMKLYVDGELTELYDSTFPWHFINIKGGEEIRISMKAVVGIGMVHSRWAAGRGTIDMESSITGNNDEELERIQKDIDTIDYTSKVPYTILRVQGGSQYDEYKIIERSISYMYKRAEILKNEFIKLYLEQSEQTNVFEANIPDETYTMINPIVYELGEVDNVIRATGKKTDDLEDIITLIIETYEPTDIVPAITQAIDTLIAKLKYIEDLFNTVKKDTYSTYLNKDGIAKDYEKRTVVANDDPHAHKWIKKSKSAKNTKNTQSKKNTKSTKSKKNTKTTKKTKK